MRRSARGFVFLAAAVVGACTLVRSEPVTPPDELRDGDAQRWAGALGRYASDPEPTSDLPRLRVALRDASPLVRQRAALAIGALGPQGHEGIGELLLALREPDTIVRGEVIFAIGRTGVRTPEVLEALYAATSDPRTPYLSRRVYTAISAFDARQKLPISAATAAALRRDVTKGNPATRAEGMNIAARTNVPWAREAFLANVSHPDPDVRLEAAWALTTLGDTSRAIENTIAGLARDSVEWLRDEVPWLQGLLRGGERSRQAACSHRVIEGPIPATVVVDSAFSGLAGDGGGPYVQGVDGVRASHGYAFNLLMSRAVNSAVPTIAARTDNGRARHLRVDLSRPFSAGSSARGVILDSAATFHTFYMYDRHGLIWNTRDIPIGARVPSARTELNVRIDGRRHILAFGKNALGDCHEAYATSGAIHGSGTTPVMIHRVSDKEFVVTAAPGSRGRLWDYSVNPAQDLGLYEFAFRIRLEGVVSR